MTDDVAFALPSLGADMDKGRVARWLKAPGEAIRRGDAIVQVETDKGLIDVEYFEDATFRAALVEEGSVVAVGTPIARLHPGAGGASGTTHDTTSTPVAPVAPAAPPAPASTQEPPPGERIYATPLARRRAEALHVDLHEVVPADGRRICLEDVLRAAHAPAPALASSLPPPPSPPTSPPPSTSSPTPPERAVAVVMAASSAATLATTPTAPTAPTATSTPTSPTTATTRDANAAMRRAIGVVMARSKREIPHYYLWQTIDAEPVLAWLAAANAQRSVMDRLLLAAPLVRAVALAAAEFPEMNGHHGGQDFEPASDVNVCFATSVRGGGLLAPAIVGADRLDIDETMKAIAGIVQRVRGGGVTAREMASGTITVTSLGDSGVQGVLPVIQPPQVAIVGFGSVFDRVVIDSDKARNARALTISVAGDHRVSDGHRGARFLRAVAQRLLQPAEP
jgi:pyruvate dehydrogenase E2 component (dihydrolipoamide acetyltransferase)